VKAVMARATARSAAETQIKCVTKKHQLGSAATALAVMILSANILTVTVGLANRALKNTAAIGT